MKLMSFLRKMSMQSRSGQTSSPSIMHPSFIIAVLQSTKFFFVQYVLNKILHITNTVKGKNQEKNTKTAAKPPLFNRAGR